MRTEIAPSFYVIGKLGHGSVEEKDAWIPPLWTAASAGIGEIADHVKRDKNGSPAGVWAIMSDNGETFNPWDAEGGKYLAGFEAVDGSPAPAGWTKWRVPGYRYLVVPTSIDEYGSVFTHVVTSYLPEKGLSLAGAVHEHYPNPDNPSVIELYFPTQRMP